MSEECVVVMDCGATTTRAIAVDRQGNLVASASRPTSPSPQSEGASDWLIWDLDEVWRKLCESCREVCQRLPRERVKAVTAVTFGADGTPLRKDGTLAYPVISWQCGRTKEFVQAVQEMVSPQEIYETTGYQVIGFNTLLKWLWLRKYAPEALAEGNRWLMMSGLLSFKLSGEMMIEPTAACTTMAMDARRRDWSKKMLSLAGLDESFFPRWSQPGDVIGKVTRKASEETGLPEGIPVVAGGHDTQFAPFGSGAKEGDALLSTGTWEIALLRSQRYEPRGLGFEEGLIIEADAKPGWWNPQVLMIASGVIEWVRRNFFGAEAGREDIHRLMIEEGSRAGVGAEGVMVVPCFVEGTGPAKKYGVPGRISGLSLSTTRGQVYRAVIEGLSYQLRQALEILSKATGFKPGGIRVVGGGGRNDLWNQTRADVTGLPAAVATTKEATVLGAAAFAFKGAGLVGSPEEFIANVDLREEVFEPSRQRRDFYEKGYETYLRTLETWSGGGQATGRWPRGQGPGRCGGRSEPTSALSKGADGCATQHDSARGNAQDAPRTPRPKRLVLDNMIMNHLVRPPGPPLPDFAGVAEALRRKVHSGQVQILGSIPLMDEIIGAYDKDPDKGRKMYRLYYDLTRGRVLKPWNRRAQEELANRRALGEHELFLEISVPRHLDEESARRIADEVYRQKRDMTACSNAAFDEVGRKLSEAGQGGPDGRVRGSLKGLAELVRGKVMEIMAEMGGAAPAAHDQSLPSVYAPVLFLFVRAKELVHRGGRYRAGDWHDLSHFADAWIADHLVTDDGPFTTTCDLIEGETGLPFKVLSSCEFIQLVAR